MFPAAVGISIARLLDMNCPVCNVELRMADRQGVEVSYCLQCRGTWLERGGLDRIIDRVMAANGGATMRSRRDSWDDDEDEHRGHRDHDDHEYQGGRKRSFFSRFFD